MVTENRLIQVVKDMTQLLETPEYEPLKNAMRLTPEFISAGLALVQAFEQNRNHRTVLNGQKQMATKEKNRTIRNLNALRAEFGDLMRRRYPKDPLLVTLDLNTKYRTVVRDGEEVLVPWKSRSESAVRNDTQLLLENIETLSDEVRQVMARSGWSDLEHTELRQEFEAFENACKFQKQRVGDYNLNVRAGRSLFKELRDWYGLARTRVEKVLSDQKHLAGLVNEAVPSLDGGRFPTTDGQATVQTTGQPPESTPDRDPDPSTNQTPSGTTQNGGDPSSTTQNNGRDNVAGDIGGNQTGGRPPQDATPQTEPAKDSDVDEPNSARNQSDEVKDLDNGRAA